MKNESAHHQAHDPSPPAFRFACSVQWNDMHATASNSDTRHCGLCERNVHLCRTVDEFDQHARAGHCVAVYESGCFAGMTSAAPSPADDSDPFDGLLTPRPFDGSLMPQPAPRPTAGMPMMPGKDQHPSEPPLSPPPPPPVISPQK